MKKTASLLRPFALLVLGSTILAGIGLSRADTLTLQPLAEKKAALPVVTSFGKGTPGENGGPYALTVKNTSQAALKVSAAIVWSVTSHNRANTVSLPAHTIEAGQSWTINDLAAEDHVTLSADGFDKLEVKVPAGAPKEVKK